MLTQVKNFHQLRPVFGHVDQKPFGEIKPDPWKPLEIVKGDISEIISLPQDNNSKVEVNEKYIDDLAPLSSISTENDFSTASI